MKKTLLTVAFAVQSALWADLYMAGDSTMYTYGPIFRPKTGWGQIMPEMVKPGIKVENRALGGRSSKSFRGEGHWDKIMSRLKPGDFVIIQFGHNDGAGGSVNWYRHANAAVHYPENLRNFVLDVRVKGAIPVLCTPVVVYQMRDGRLVNTPKHQSYVDAVKRIAKEEKVDLLDLNACALEEMSRDPDPKRFFMFLQPGKYKNYPDGCNDGVHLSEAGARFYAEAAVRLAKRQNLPIAQIFR